MSAFETAPKLDPSNIQAPEQQYALVPYRDLAELLRPRRGIWFRIGVIAPWAIAAFFWFFALKSVSEQRAIQVQSLSQGESFVNLAASISDQNKQVGSVVNSLQNLTGAVASSSARADAIEARLERTQRDLKSLESKLWADQQSTTIPKTSTIIEVKPLPRTRSHEMAEDLIPTIQGAELVRDTTGHLAYWLIPRVVSGRVHMIKVLPIRAHPLGVLVHDTEGNEDYIVTHSGSWIREAASKSSSAPVAARLR
jgi:hypothetical protein